MEYPVAATLSELPEARLPYADAAWMPVRNHFALSAFGVNAFRAARAGDNLINEHTHSGPGVERHQELYFVHTGRATFTVDGVDIDAPAGTFVSARDIATRRSARAAVDDTVVLVIGGEANAPFTVTAAEREELGDAGMEVQP